MLRELGRDRSVYALDLPGFVNPIRRRQNSPSRISRLRSVISPTRCGYAKSTCSAISLARSSPPNLRSRVLPSATRHLLGIPHPIARTIAPSLGSREDGQRRREEWRNMLLERGLVLPPWRWPTISRIVCARCEWRARAGSHDGILRRRASAAREATVATAAAAR